MASRPVRGLIYHGGEYTQNQPRSKPRDHRGRDHARLFPVCVLAGGQPPGAKRHAMALDRPGRAAAPQERAVVRILATERGSVTTYTLNELFEKRAELAGQILQAEKQARQLREDLAHVEATIRILRPGIELPKVVPRRVEFRPRYFKRGQLTRLILDYLREHPGEPVAVADIMPAAVGNRNLNSAEYRRVEVVTYEALHKLAKRGTVEQAGQGATAARFVLS